MGTGPGTMPEGTADELWAKACTHLAEQTYDVAAALFQRFGRRYPDDLRAAEAGYRVLESRWLRRYDSTTHPGAAIAAFVRRHPNTLWAARALLLGADARVRSRGRSLVRPSWRRRCLHGAMATFRAAVGARAMTAEEADEYAQMQLRQAGDANPYGEQDEAPDPQARLALLRSIASGPAFAESRAKALLEVADAERDEAKWGENEAARAAARKDAIECYCRIMDEFGETDAARASAGRLADVLEEAGRPKEAEGLRRSPNRKQGLSDYDAGCLEKITQPSVSWYGPHTTLPGRVTALALHVRNAEAIEVAVWRVDLAAFWPDRVWRAWQWESAREAATNHQQWRQPVRQDDGLQAHEVDLPVPELPPGLYQVQIWPAGHPEQARAQPLSVGTLTLLQHDDDDRLAIHAVDRESGRSVAGCEVTVCLVDGWDATEASGVATGRTDSVGLWTVRPRGDDGRKSSRAHAVGRLGDECCLVTADYFHSRDIGILAAHACTDRPVY